VQTLRRMWVNQFYVEDDRVTWRDRAELLLVSLRLDSLYDPEARYSNKPSTTWSSYFDAAHPLMLSSTLPSPPRQ
jgi:hypothetical protein